MNQITTRYVTENGACYEQYVITDAEAKTELVITPERGGMITGFTLDGDEYIWTRRPNFSESSRPRFQFSVFPVYLPQISSKVSVMAVSGAGVASETATIAMHAARNAGSSS